MTLTKKQKLAITAIVLAGALAAAALLLPERPKDDREEEAPHPTDTIPFNAAQMKAAAVTLANAEPARLHLSITLPGQIRANADRTAHVMPRVPGRVERVLADLGQKVKKGDVLAVLSSDELAERRSAALTARQRLDLARDTLQREERLWRERISPEQDVLQARAAHAEAQIAARNAQTRLAVLDAGQSGRLDAYELRAPADGTVLEKHLAVGEAVGNDTVIFTIADMTSVWAEVSAAPAELARLGIGTRATIVAPALNARADGTVVQVAAALGEQTRMATARIALANADALWRPGLFVDAVIPAPPADVPVAVRSDALHTVEGGTVLFVRTADGFAPKPVRTGRSDGPLTEVLEGVSAGTQYAAANSFILKAELGKESGDHGH